MAPSARASVAATTHTDRAPPDTSPHGLGERWVLMQSRRKFLTALAAAPLSACNTVQNGGANFAAAGGVASAYVGFSSEERKPVALPSSRRAELARETVSYGGGEQPGTIVIATSERRLYLVLSGGAAIRYPVGVGRAGKQWQGRA